MFEGPRTVFRPGPFLRYGVVALSLCGLSGVRLRACVGALGAMSGGGGRGARERGGERNERRGGRAGRERGSCGSRRQGAAGRFGRRESLQDAGKCRTGGFAGRFGYAFGEFGLARVAQGAGDGQAEVERGQRGRPKDGTLAEHSVRIRARVGARPKPCPTTRCARCVSGGARERLRGQGEWEGLRPPRVSGAVQAAWAGGCARGEEHRPAGTKLRRDA